jgi:hypothetical protein
MRGSEASHILKARRAQDSSPQFPEAFAGAQNDIRTRLFRQREGEDAAFLYGFMTRYLPRLPFEPAPVVAFPTEVGFG